MMVIPFAFLNPTTVIIVVIVALLVFGPHKMPELMRQLGQALREFKKITGDVQGVFSLDDHLSYDRYEPPAYSYTPPPTSYEPLDQYHDEHAELEHPVLEATPVVEEKPKRKRAPRKKAETAETGIATDADAIAPKPRRKRVSKVAVEAETGTNSETFDVKELESPQG
jgi:sec-independent protein translocase protein TatA